MYRVTLTGRAAFPGFAANASVSAFLDFFDFDSVFLVSSEASVTVTASISSLKSALCLIVCSSQKYFVRVSVEPEDEKSLSIACDSS